MARISIMEALGRVLTASKNYTNVEDEKLKEKLEVDEQELISMLEEILEIDVEE